MPDLTFFKANEASYVEACKLETMDGRFGGKRNQVRIPDHVTYPQTAAGGEKIRQKVQIPLCRYRLR